MIVNEVVVGMSTHEKMNVLDELRNDIGEAAYRRAVAKVQTKYFIDLWNGRDKKFKVTDLYNRVNLRLMGYEVEPMSYSYFREFVK